MKPQACKDMANAPCLSASIHIPAPEGLVHATPSGQIG
jgi:hypothetical protein